MASGTSSIRAPGEPGKGRTLIFGSGDTVDAGAEHLSDRATRNLGNLLAHAGYGVDVDNSSTLPSTLNQYRSIWFISTNPLTSRRSQRWRRSFRRSAVYLTGEHPCCDALNNADGLVVDALVTGGGVQIGGQGFADVGTGPEAVNSQRDRRALP